MFLYIHVTSLKTKIRKSILNGILSFSCNPHFTNKDDSKKNKIGNIKLPVYIINIKAFLFEKNTIELIFAPKNGSK